MFWNAVFEIFPYISVSFLIIGTVYAFTSNQYGITSRSTEFFGRDGLFWGSVPWHYGILFALLGHFLAFAVPSFVLTITSAVWSLVLTDSFVFACGLLAAFGIAVLIFRRLANRYVARDTSFFDWVILILLLFQALSGLYISLRYKWGVNWFSSNVSEYLYSLLKFAPRADYMTVFPPAVKLHAANLFLLLAVLPFTRLIHIFTAPVKYLFRRRIIFRWNR